MAKRVVAIDPEAEEIEKAKKKVSESLESKLKFQVGRGEELPFPEGSYDLVFFTYSLCCISPPYMRKALEEAASRVREADPSFNFSINDD